jgi:undecaprenyl diphosphate synthase
MATTTTKKQFYSKEELRGLDPTKVPHHIAIVPDGNRRWAARNLFKVAFGHERGCEIIKEILLASRELGVKIMTLYTFSTENWHRPQDEIETLMDLLVRFLKCETPFMIEEGIQFGTIGTLDRLPLKVQEAIINAKEATSQCKDSRFIMAINYGGRDEICRAAERLAEDVASGKIAKGTPVDEALFSSYLDTKEWSDPELLIRAGGEQRISNFLLWQLSYAEIYLTNTLWPEMSPKELLESILWYQTRTKRLGR